MKKKSYIVAYTLKHNDIADKFEDRYMVWRHDECDSPALLAATFYQNLITNDGDGNSKEWYVYSASLAQVLDSTDYSS